MGTSTRRSCAAPDCSGSIPKGSALNQRYCSPRCRNRMNRRRYNTRRAEREATAEVNQLLPPGIDDNVVTDFLTHRSERMTLASTGGAAYQKMMATPAVLEPLLRGEMSFDVAGELLGYHPSTVSKVMEMVAQQLRTARDAATWEMSERAIYLAGLDLGDPPSDPDELEVYLDNLTQRFVEWREEICTDERGKPYITKGFHRDWIRSILWAIFTGNRQMILSPPRHGKTQLLIDFCNWLICRDPYIRILWIASNGDLSEDWLAAIKEQFEENEKLRSLYLAPGQDFKPPARSGKSWSRTQFSVATRQRVVKSPSMQGVGRRGRILSRDVDLMIIDDIEDDESTSTPGTLAKTRKWIMVTAGSRKMSFTGVVLIGSRQDPEDLYGHLLENSEWSCIVEEAHDSNCELDPEDEKLHRDCMLFPELNDYAWLMSQKRSMALEGGSELFEMVYLNRAIPRGLQVFDAEAMKSCRNESYPIGYVPPGSKLVAGLDPAVAGHQSVVLWAYQPGTGRIFMVDGTLDTGPGIEGFIEIMRLWLTRYPQLRHWIVESNGFQRGYARDADVRRIKDRHHLHLEPHETQINKWDPRIGVGAMAKLFKQVATWRNPVTDRPEHAPVITLPYSGTDAVALTDAYIRQARNFGSAASQARTQRVAYKSDLLMASWFPMKVIRRWSKEAAAQSEVEMTYRPEFSDYRPSFDFEEAPWPLH